MVKKKKSSNFYGSTIEKGTLHTALGIDKDKPIPASALNTLVNADIGDTVTVNGKKKTVTSALKKKAVFAKNAKKFKH